MRLFFVVITGVIVLHNFGISALAKTLYVNNTGTPACSDATTYANNDAASPWCTIGRATWGNASRASSNGSEAAAAGDTVYITAGTYSHSGTGGRYKPLYSTVNSGSSGSPIVIEAVGTVTLTLSSGSGPLLGVSTYDDEIGGTKSYVTYKGFTIYETDAPGVTDSGMVMIAGGTGNRIENCTFVGDVESTLENNHSGIWLTGDTSTVIKNNSISNFLNNGVLHWNAPGIMMYDTTDSIVEHNEIENCGTGIFWKGWDNSGNIIRYNLVTNSGGGVTIGDIAPSVMHKVYQNLFVGNNGAVTMVDLVDDSIQGTVYVVNNTSVNCGVDNDESSTHSMSEWVDAGAIDAVYQQNNIIYRSSGTTLVGIGAYNWLHWDETLLDYNVYYGVTRWKKSANNYSSLADWRTALGGCPDTGNDCASITSDPLFVGSGSYKLQVGSPALTLGRTITAIHGSSGETIPAGAYITGNEVIGIDDGEEEPPASTPTISGVTVPGGVRINQ